MSYVTAEAIKMLRERRSLTQRELAEAIGVSDKAVSKWETGRGLPDVTLVEPLARTLGISVAELLSGECMTNGNVSANMMRTRFYICPICGNVIHAIGEGAYSCCGVLLPRLRPSRSIRRTSLLRRRWTASSTCRSTIP